MDRDPRDRTIAASAGQAASPSWPALLLGLVPFATICFSVGWWDRISPRVAGLPFNIFWLILWILVTPLCLWAAYRCERRNSEERADGQGKEPR